MHNSFETKLSKFIEDKNISKTLSEQGKIFEKLTKKILQIEPTFLNELKEVYMWGEFATKFNVDGRDIGIDLMAQTHKDEWISVQCKDFQFSHRLSEGDLKGFLGLHNIEDKNGKKIIEISYRYVFHTCKTTTDHFIKSCNQASTPVKIYGFYELENLNLDWNSLKDTDINTLQVSKQKKLRPYQKEALEAIKGHFLDKNEARAKVIMACGTGKSLLSIRTIDSIVSEGEIALFFAPSLALINQMLREFFRESQSESYKVFAVCSDSKVGNDEDLRAKDIDIPVISSPSNLNKHITHYLKENKKIIIFSTYQSIDIVTQAQKLFKKEIKLIINDEAHRTTGYEKLSAESEKILSLWQKTHDNEFLNAKYRLYLTATPRVFSDKTKEKTKEKELNLFSMDDEDIFGKEIFSFDFNKAVEGGFLCDYKVIITFINKDSIDFSKLLTVKNKNFKIEDISQMLGLYKAICKEDLYLLGDENKTLSPFENDKDSMKRIVSFHSSINNSKFLKKNFCILDKNLDETMTEHIDGTDNASVKNAKLSWLKNDDEANFKILSNAKCLTEGIDVPSLDGVCFFDPRDSVVDIIQAVGRVMRKAPSKKYGYIILPIALSDKEIKTHEKSLNSKGFKNIWKVLKAIRSHDERLVDPQRISEVVKISSSKNAGGFERNTNETVKNQLFSLHELANEIKNAVPEKLGDANYWELYAKKVGPTMQDLTLRIEELLRNKKGVNALFESFTKALQDNLNASFVKSETLALIAQHIITKPIFSHIFPHIDFTKFDKVSFELERFYKELCKFGLQDELKNLKKFYANVQKSAEYAQSDEAKQNLIKSLYENLFKAAFKKTQEKLGIVYTPIELVDFIIYSLEFVLKKHFDKSLSDKGVNIYDPFTGTGTFITRLIQSGLLDKNLEHKYKNELWANEITLLGYYIAQINITAIMHQRLKELDPKKDKFILLDNLLFTDTFNTYTQDSKGFKGDTKLDFKAKYFAKNYAKINELKKAEFKVIMGNPPYSANQNSANDDNKNTNYPALEERVKETYVIQSKSQKFKYDSYKMALRYASDRIEKDGVIGFVTNASFIDGSSDDGLRACLEEEFDVIYIFNLRGKIDKNNKNDSEGGNVFNITVPTSISILIKDSKMRKGEKTKAEIYYYDIGDYLNREEKLNIIDNFESIEGIKAWQKITPNEDYDWINQRDYSFMKLISIGVKKLKFKTLKNNELNIFLVFSMGIVSNRDDWVYNFSKKALQTNMAKMIENYNVEVNKKEKDTNYKPVMEQTYIKWTRNLFTSFNKKQKFNFKDSGLIVLSHYRPFTKCHSYIRLHKLKI
ncbi:DEAD/DEAH box helicase family protein [Campylobacter upsaliensis]